MSRLVRIVKLSSTIVPVSVKDTAEPTNHFSTPYPYSSRCELLALPAQKSSVHEDRLGSVLHE